VTRLSVNLNKVARLRNPVDIVFPSVVHGALVCFGAGAEGITVHPRPDERHIRPGDVRDLAAAIDVELNIEGNPVPEFLALVREVRPAQCTLVPDGPDQRTSDHGWTLTQGPDAKRLEGVLRELRDLGIRTSLFMDPEPEQVAAAAPLGADCVELYTEAYARAYGTAEEEACFDTYRRAADRARECGLGINAGHDLSLENLARFLSIPDVLEVSIGHALMADALFMGLDAAVRAYHAITAAS
jgi:pyridoxine 5-phosphate synthase